MNLVTIVGSMTASAALTLGIVYVLVWLNRGASRANLWFAVASVSAAALAAVELIMLAAPSVDTYAAAQRWQQLPLTLLLGSLLPFADFYFRAGLGRWSWLVAGWLVLVLAVGFAAPYGINYGEITALVPTEILGQTLQLAEGTPGRWRRLNEISALVVLGFVLHAAATAWRRNEHRDRPRAMVVGSALSLFLILLASQLFFGHTGRLVSTAMSSPLFLIPLAAMAYQTSCDLHRSSQLDAELDESQERLALAAEAANLDFWEYDPERDRFWISEPLVELFGFTPGEPITLATWLEKVHPDDRPGVADKAARLLATGGRMEFEYRIIAPSGEIRWLSARGRYLAERGSFAYGINLDVTQQREQLYERDQLQQQLAHASRVTMLGQFASALAHELNQPLGAILRNTEAAELLLAAPAPDLEQLRAITQDILRDDRRASEVIARLRKMLKQQAREHRAVDVAILFSDVLALVQPEAAARGISLQSTLEAGAMVVRGDPVHLQQVLLNLVINGMQAVDSGSASERSVRISALPRDDGMLEFSVSDSGPGLPAGLEKRVFEPFFTTRTTGMGLGLSICRTIIEAHGGRIWVDAQAGGGTAFRFTLPIEPESVAS